MRKVLSLIISAMLLVGSFSIIGVYASPQITVTLNGTYINFDVQPTEINGRVLVPVRAIFEALGAKVDWNESKNEVIATKGDVTIRLYKDNTTMYRNNETITLDVSAKEIDDRILVPVRAISEAFGCKVEWNGSKNQVIIESDSIIGTCGENLTWELIDSTLYINGYGQMNDYFYEIFPPWYEYRKNIEKVIVDSGVTSISRYAFFELENLKSLYISDSVNYIGVYWLSKCTSLESIDVAEKNTNYMSIDDVLFSKDKKKIIKYPAKKLDKKYCIPDGVQIIDLECFENNASIANITIPNSVYDIDLYAFRNCSALTDITIPDSVTSIGASAFSDCKKLKNVVLSSNISTINFGTFAYCDSITNIIIPANVTTIENFAFGYCSNLKEVQILGETKIEMEPFVGCDDVIIVEKNNSNTNSSSPLDENELRMHILSLGWSVYSDYPVPDYGDITGQRRNYTDLSADLWYIYDNYFYPTSVDNDVKTYCKVLELCGFEFESERELSEYATTQTASITYRYKNTPLRVLIIREVWNRTASKEYTVRVYPFYGDY